MTKCTYPKCVCSWDQLLQCPERRERELALAFLENPHYAGIRSLTWRNAIGPVIVGLVLFAVIVGLVIASTPKAHATEDNDPKEAPTCQTRFYLQEVNPAAAVWTELSAVQMVAARQGFNIPDAVVTMMIGQMGDAYKLYGFKADGCRHGGMRISPGSAQMIVGDAS